MRTKSRARMTLLEVTQDMAARGSGMHQLTVANGIASGHLPFGKVLHTSTATGRRTFLIWRKDYEAWADEFLGPIQ